MSKTIVPPRPADLTRIGWSVLVGGECSCISSDSETKVGKVAGMAREEIWFERANGSERLIVRQAKALDSGQKFVKTFYIER